MATDTRNKVVEAEARPTETDVEVGETGMRPDLLWDNEAPGADRSLISFLSLCHSCSLSVYGSMK